MDFGNRLKDLRIEKRISQSELGKRIGVSNASISQYESGTRFPDTQKLELLADVLEVSTDYLLGRKIPEWATEEDVFELDKMLNSNVNMSYGGENLTDEEKQRVKDILTGIFWEKLEKRKRRGASE